MSEILADKRIKLDGENVNLRINRRAADEITAYFGNYLEAFRKLAEFDANAYYAIVAAGLGKKLSDVRDEVFRTGLPSLTADLSDYVSLLSRGGRPEVEDKDAAPGKE